MTEPVVIDPLELRAHPELLREMREQPGRHIERRVVTLANVETRASGDGWKGGGLAAVFDELSHNLGGFRETIEHGAFRKVLKTDPDVRALFNHDPNYLLGRTAAGTLRLKEISAGLDYEFDAPATSYAADLRVLMDRGDLNQSSFAFRIARGGDSWDEDPETGALIRTIHEFAELYDVSPVTDPAYPQTTSGVRSIDKLLGEINDLADEDRAAVVAALRSNGPARPSAQHVTQGEVSQQGGQGAGGDDLAPVHEPAQGERTALAARRDRLRELAPRVRAR